MRRRIERHTGEKRKRIENRERDGKEEESDSEKDIYISVHKS